MLEYIVLVLDKLLGQFMPIRFLLFVMAGLSGVFVYLAFMSVCFKLLHLEFFHSQILATFAAMTMNFNLNNVVTFRDRRLRGLKLLYGHLSFYLVCSVGVLANVEIAQLLFELKVPWALAGLLGAVVGAVWNYGVSSTLTWRARA